MILLSLRIFLSPFLYLFYHHSSIYPSPVRGLAVYFVRGERGRRGAGPQVHPSTVGGVTCPAPQLLVLVRAVPFERLRRDRHQSQAVGGGRAGRGLLATGATLEVEEPEGSSCGQRGE